MTFGGSCLLRFYLFETGFLIGLKLDLRVLLDSAFPVLGLQVCSRFSRIFYEGSWDQTWVLMLVEQAVFVHYLPSLKFIFFYLQSK